MEERKLARPDFGMHETEHQGVKLTCSYVVPGLTMSDLVQIFHDAERQAEPHDQFSANPAVWPTVRGVSAVTDAILDAIYGK